MTEPLCQLGAFVRDFIDTSAGDCFRSAVFVVPKQRMDANDFAGFSSDVQCVCVVQIVKGHGRQMARFVD